MFIMYQQRIVIVVFIIIIIIIVLSRFTVRSSAVRSVDGP